MAQVGDYARGIYKFADIYAFLAYDEAMDAKGKAKMGKICTPDKGSRALITEFNYNVVYTARVRVFRFC